MKKFHELTKEEQAKAKDLAFNELVDSVANGLIQFGTVLQLKIDDAIKAAHKANMQWSKHEYVIEAAGTELRKMARDIAEESRYSEAGQLLKENEL